MCSKSCDKLKTGIVSSRASWPTPRIIPIQRCSPDSAASSASCSRLWRRTAPMPTVRRRSRRRRRCSATRSCMRSRAKSSRPARPAARSSSRRCACCCCRATRTMTATSFWSCAPVSAGKNRRSLRIVSIECTPCTPTRTAGRPRLRTSTRRSSAACVRQACSSAGRGRTPA